MIRKERFQEVFLALEKGSSVFFEDDEFYFYCGEIQRSFKDYLKAINQYSKAIELGKKKRRRFFPCSLLLLESRKFVFENREI